MDDNNLNISIILCTWNNSRRLNITLESFLNLEIPSSLSWELVLVNNNSTDSTEDIVCFYMKKLPIVYIEEPVQGLSNARNAGLRKAKGELIVFTDDDVKPCKNWLRTYWHAYQLNPEGSFWGGPVESEFESNYVNHNLLLYAPPSVRGLSLGNEVRPLGMKEYLISANWACPSLALKKIGGFDVGKGLNSSSKRLSIGEETDLMERLKCHGFKAIYLPPAKISHYVPQNKSSLRHISSRSKAWGFYCGEKESLKIRSGRKIFGVPLWLYREVAETITHFCYGLLKCKIDYKSYLECYHLLGFIEAVKKFERDRK